MKNQRGFTLIELLIVVAIIAILAAIAVPNFLEAQTRAKVSRVKSDMRSLATAIESFSVDFNEHPAEMACNADTLARIASKNGVPSPRNNIWGSYDGVAEPWSQNAGLVEKKDGTWRTTSPGFYRSTFDYPGKQSGSGGWKRTIPMLTTPVAYIAALPADPFTKAPFVNFGYTRLAGKDWIMWSAGPDMDLAYNADKDGIIGSPLDVAFTSYTATAEKSDGSFLSLQGSMRWNELPPGAKMPRNSTRSKWLLSDGSQKRIMSSFWVDAIDVWEDAGAEVPWNYTGDNPTTGLLHMTYDATNGSLSNGDVWKLND